MSERMKNNERRSWMNIVFCFTEIERNCIFRNKYFNQKITISIGWSIKRELYVFENFFFEFFKFKNTYKIDENRKQVFFSNK